MGKQHLLGVDPGLESAVIAGLTEWSKLLIPAAPSAPARCRKEECNLENEVRSALQDVRLNSKDFKGCCKSTARRNNSVRFPYKCGKYRHQQGWFPTTISLSPDICCTQSGKTIIAEIKITSALHNQMDFLMGTDSQLDHSIKRTHFFTVHDPEIRIQKTMGGSGITRYYSELAEGQLWMDLLRLFKAGKHFSKTGSTELYMILFTKVKITTDRLAHTLNAFNTKIPFLYHTFDKPTPHTLRSATVEFDYHYKELSVGDFHAYLVRLNQPVA